MWVLGGFHPIQASFMDRIGFRWYFTSALTPGAHRLVGWVHVLQPSEERECADRNDRSTIATNSLGMERPIRMEVL